MENAKQVLDAIEKSGARTESGLHSLAKEIRHLSDSIANTSGVKKNGNGTHIGVIAVFATVVISLGSIFFMALEAQGRIIHILDDHQQGRVRDLDEKLQVEIQDSQDEVIARFGDYDDRSQARHDEQAGRIERIENWFGPPRPKSNRAAAN